ncbi:MAG: hypothetical protein IK078_05245 [Lachnospiraceae bacterium]|nr:hypothetical protein [Lachnospiraceae bacterium]
MKKDVFNTIVVDNIDCTLVSVTLTGGMRIAQELLIEGNRTSRTEVTFIKIEDTYVGIRKRTEVTYDYSGQTRKGDVRHADFYMGYDEIVALEFFDKNAALVTENEVKAAGGTSENRHGIIVKPKSELTKKAKEREKKEKEDQLFIPSAGDI